MPSEDVLPQSVLSFDSDPEDIVSILLNDFAFAASQQSIAVCSEDGKGSCISIFGNNSG